MDDTTIKSLFDYAKQGPLGGGEFPLHPVVFFTFVRHNASLHPPKNKDSEDLVNYASGPLALSSDKKALSGENKLWRNNFNPGQPPFFGSPAVPPDAFVDDNDKVTVAVTVFDSGKATFEMKINGKPVGGPGASLVSLGAASYSNGLFAQTANSEVDSLSFTLGTDQSS